MSLKVHSTAVSGKLENEKRKQDLISLQKELIKVREQLDVKTRESLAFQEKASRLVNDHKASKN
jgi:hypothetical protein